MFGQDVESMGRFEVYEMQISPVDIETLKNIHGEVNKIQQLILIVTLTCGIST